MGKAVTLKIAWMLWNQSSMRRIGSVQLLALPPLVSAFKVDQALP